MTISHEGAARALSSALCGDPDWEVRAAAARSLGWAADTPEIREALRAAAEGDPREEVRAAAGRALGASR